MQQCLEISLLKDLHCSLHLGKTNIKFERKKIILRVLNLYLDPQELVYL